MKPHMNPRTAILGHAGSAGGRTRERRGRKRTLVAWFAIALLVVVGGTLTGAQPSAAASGAASIPLGDYAGPDNPSGIARFASTTGAHLSLATDYLVGSSGWENMVSAGGLRAWRTSGYTLVLGVPVLPRHSRSTLARGARGAYKRHFVTLAQNLVNAGEANAYLRLGWEFNGTWYKWSVRNATQANQFAAYFRKIVTAMRSVPGQSFKFVWNPNGAGPTAYTPDQAYPGNAYVDYIGSDVYGNCWCNPFTPQNGWSHQLSQPWGLNWLASFAGQMGKPIVFPEWSVDYRSDGHGLGDNPYFVNQFAAWITSHNVAWTNIFAFNSAQQNDITDGNFPNALAAFKVNFG
jgi:hypothetical protein